MDLGLLLFRLVVGLTLAAHGSQKLFGVMGGGGIAGTGGFFENQFGFRPGKVYATMAGVTEFAAGLGLALGLLTPVSAAAIVGTMVVAGVAAHKDAGFFITKGGYEYTFIIASGAAMFAFTGPGELSIDNALGFDLSGVAWGTIATLFGVIAGCCILAGRGRITDPEDEATDTADSAEVTGGVEATFDRAESHTAESHTAESHTAESHGAGAS